METGIVFGSCFPGVCREVAPPSHPEGDRPSLLRLRCLHREVLARGMASCRHGRRHMPSVGSHWQWREARTPNQSRRPPGRTSSRACCAPRRYRDSDRTKRPAFCSVVVLSEAPVLVASTGRSARAHCRWRPGASAKHNRVTRSGSFAAPHVRRHRAPDSQARLRCDQCMHAVPWRLGDRNQLVIQQHNSSCFCSPGQRRMEKVHQPEMMTEWHTASLE